MFRTSLALPPLALAALALILVSRTLAPACPPSQPQTLDAAGCSSAHGESSLARASTLCLALTGKSPQALRELGPEGLARILDIVDRDRTRAADLAPAVDLVAGQKDALASRLYWYTDLESAKNAASRQGKPLLYLRLLGNLTDEYSCANSRFFRTVLYADPSVAAVLREQFILVWQSERPVPVVTINFGDGRELKRTITGNSIHYVLDSRGRVFDAAPGLMDGPRFVSIITAAATAIRAQSRAFTENGPREHAALAARQIEAEYTRAVAHSNRPEFPTPAPASLSSAEMPVRDRIPAAEAAPRAMGKSVVERPMLQAFLPLSPMAISESDDQAWTRLAELRPVSLSEESKALMRSQDRARASDSASFQRMVSEFERLIAADSARNQFAFRLQILYWIAAESLPLSTLNERVYGSLFLTPSSDLWLGLVPEHTYSALTADGRQITP